MWSRMRVDAYKAVQVMTEALQGPEKVKEGVQLATLKNALDSEKAAAAELLKQLEPKGRIIDIRV
mgnify:CR=1 FL=1